MPPTAEECTAARIAAGALKRELKKLDTWHKAGAVSPEQRAEVVKLLHELERRANPNAPTSTGDESKPLKQKTMGFEVPK